MEKRGNILILVIVIASAIIFGNMGEQIGYASKTTLHPNYPQSGGDSGNIMAQSIIIKCECIGKDWREYKKNCAGSNVVQTCRRNCDKGCNTATTIYQNGVAHYYDPLHSKAFGDPVCTPPCPSVPPKRPQPH